MTEIRWQQRFENFEKIYLLFNSALEKPDLSDLEKEGIIQRFEITFELAWKTAKDYLEFTGIVFEQITPRETIKQGFKAGVIKNGQVWMDILEWRNKTSHEYDLDIIRNNFDKIKNIFLPEITQLYNLLKNS